MTTRIFGFAILRNGVKYDYSFCESLQSLGQIVEQVYLALGDSEDKTEEAIADFNFIKKIPTVWDMSLKEGLVLSVETNKALEALRKDFRGIPHTWGLYLQCDEIIHEEEYERVKHDIHQAEINGYDAVCFRYIHFWQTHHHIAINKKWYPQEVRAVKLDSEAVSCKDAQGFENCKRIFQSEATIYHYGHVRDPQKYLKKKREILDLYSSPEELKKWQQRERKHDRRTECLLFFGNHPKVMHERIKRIGYEEVPMRNEIFVVGYEGRPPESLVRKIKAKTVNFVATLGETKQASGDNIILMKPTWWQRIRYRSHIPVKARSKFARQWSQDFLLMLKLSEKRIGLQSTE